MVQFLTTTGISYRLEDIIKTATECLVIISPFLKVNDRLKELFEDRDRMKIDIRVIYGKNELQSEENNWLESMTSVRTSFHKNLHAKCYMNEKEALLTSMNLYEFSQVNNSEMGLLISRDDEPELYEQIREESMRILMASEEIRVTVAEVEATEDDRCRSGMKGARRNFKPTLETPNRGVCIRCKDDISANPTQPYCKRCYASWKRYENKDYEDKYCHICGKEHVATLLKPLCLVCYRKYKDVLKFAGGA